MKVVVQDASVLIDLAAADLLAAWFSLGIETLTGLHGPRGGIDSGNRHYQAGTALPTQSEAAKKGVRPVAGQVAE